ncbi:MAG TPA: Hsp70 family protein, partial [Sandaracinaceae bacterium LLY-WYZ-13_1]|nr:Hsp70 family protein [Sandaracinaceae bacterium LLY-WYZ-13_1]
MAPVLGIDLGTTNSVVCVADGGSVRILPDGEGNPLVPSVVSFHPAGDVLVGHAARERRLLDARNTIYSVKRLIGRPYRSPEVSRAEERFPFELCEGPTQGVLVRARGETYTLPEISAFVLREVRRIAEERLGESCTQAVITVPANFNELQRSATKAAGRVAGLEVLRILNEPTAAALAYGYGKGSRERVAVFDLGGGTFDITILELAGDVFEVLSTAGDTFLGGDDVDVLIAEKMADAFLEHHRFDPRQDAQAYERLRAAAEWAKCQLSSETEVQLRVEELAYGEGGASLDLTFGLTRAALEKLARPLIGRAFDVCEDAMRVAGVRPTQLDNVILVGGSTRMPLVRSMVGEYFHRDPLASIDPDLVVARGAALQGAALAPQRGEASGPKKLAKVALKRMTVTDLEAARSRREELAEEAREGHPPQPAFQPPRAPVPVWDEMDELPTRIARTDDRPAEASAAPTRRASDLDELLPPTEQETRAAASAFADDPTQQPTRAAASPYEAAAVDDGTSQPTAAAASAYREEAARASRPPPPPDAVRADRAVPVGDRPEPAPERPPRRRRPPPAPGGSTLGFGSGGLPVPDLGDQPPAAESGSPPSSPVEPEAWGAAPSPPASVPDEWGAAPSPPAPPLPSGPG